MSSIPPNSPRVDLTIGDDATRLNNLLKEEFKWIDLSALRPEFEVFSQWIGKLADLRKDGIQIQIAREWAVNHLKDLAQLQKRVNRLSLRHLGESRYLLLLQGAKA